jgi:RHS repeat-associated protein
MTTTRNALCRFAHGAGILAVALLLCISLTPAAYAQAFCTVPGTPPAPPPPPKPPQPCKPKQCKNCSASPCYLASGVYTTDDLDLQVETAGFRLFAARTYESNQAVDGPVGVGWKSNLLPRVHYATYLKASPSIYFYTAELVMMDGSVTTFTGEPNGTFSAPFGNKDTLVRNADGTWDYVAEGQTTRHRFNADGTIQRIVDRYGNALSYVYGANGRLSRVQDDAGSGRFLDVGWGASGRIATIADNSGRAIRYDYAADGTLIAVTNPLDQVKRLTYVPGRFGPLLKSIRDHWNRVITELEWYDDDKLMSYTEGLYTGPDSRGEKYSYLYFPAPPIPHTLRQHSLGQTSYPYNPDSWVVDKPGTIVDHGSGDILEQRDGASTVSYTYDAQGRRLTMTRGGVYWKFTYDTNFPTEVASAVAYTSGGYTTVHPDWPAEFYTYAAPGQPGAGSLAQTDRARQGSTTTRDWLEKITYDSRGRVLTYTEAGGYTTSYAYNAHGDIESVTTPAGATTLTYDTLGRPLSITNPMGQVKSTTWDALGRPLTETLPLPAAGSPAFTTTYAYDLYDSAKGWTYMHVTDPNGKVTKVGFDALGNLAEEIDALNNVTTWTYKYNLLDSITDANGNSTRYVYNSVRDHAQTIYPNGGTETFVMTNGLVFSKTDRRGITTGYTYDAFDRPTKILARQDNQNLETTDIAYAGYKLMSVSYQVGSAPADAIAYTYDDAWRMETETQGARARITYGYFTGNATDRVRTYGVGSADGTVTWSTATYAYDSMARIRTINWSKDPAGPYTFNYNALGQYTSIDFPNGQQRIFTYDGQARLKSVQNTDSGGGNIVRYAYTWDYNWATLSTTMLGQVSHVDVTADTLAEQPVGRTKYTYDAKYRLSRVDYPGSGSFESWTYDAIGNRLQAVASGSAPVNYTYYQNAANRNTQRLLNDGGTSNLLYDPNGNYTGRSGASVPHVYDAQNRLTVRGSQVDAVYDASGRRIKAGAGSVTEKSFIYEGEMVIGEKTAGHNLDFSYLMGPGLDEPLAVTITDGSLHYFAVDGQGSVLGMIDAADDSYSHPMHYSPFGRQLEIQDFRIPTYGYTGRERSGPEYWYYRHRHYDARLGRFTSEDPIQEYVPVIGASQYSYVDHQPTMYTDPFGLQKCNSKWKVTKGPVQTDWAQDWALITSQTLPKVSKVSPKGIMGKFVKKPGVSSTGTLIICYWRKMGVFTKYRNLNYSVTVDCQCPDSSTTESWTMKEILNVSKYTGQDAKKTYGTIGLFKYTPCPKP